MKKIVVDKDKARLYYRLPVPPDGRGMEEVRVLSIYTPSGDRETIGRTLELVFSLTI